MKLNAILIFALTITGPATAATPIHIDAPFAKIDFDANVTTPSALSNRAISTTHGFWLGGKIGNRRGIALYNSDGTLNLIRYADVDNAQLIGYLVTPPLGSYLLAPASDGGVFATIRYVGGFGEGECTVTRYSADASMLWNVSACPSAPALGADGAGGLWIYVDNGVAKRIRPDGSAIVSIDAAIESQSDALAVNPSAAGLYRAAGNVITLIDADGHSHAVWQSTDASTVIDHLAVGADGNLYASATIGGALAVLSVTPQGVQRWSHTTTKTTGKTMSIAVASDGTIGLIQNDGTVTKFGADDTPRFVTTTASFGDCYEDEVGGVPISGCLAAVSGSDLIVTFVNTNSDAAVERFADNGSVLGVSTKTNLIPEDVAVLDDGSVIVTLTDFPNGFVLARFDRAGQPLAVANLQNVIDDDSSLVASKPAADGTDYILTQGTTMQALSRIGSDGAVVWKQLLTSIDTYPSSTIDSSADRVCVNRSGKIDCFAAADGHVLYSLSPRRAQAWRVLDDDSVAIVYEQATESTAAEYVIVDPSGAPAPGVQLSATFTQARFAINGSGMLIASDLSLPHKVYGYDRTGKLLYSKSAPIAYDNAQDTTPFLSADGTAIFNSYLGVQDANFAQSYTLWALSPTGASLWVDQLDAGYVLYDLQFRGSEFFVSSSSFPSTQILPQAQAFSLADGSLVWDRDVDATHLNDGCSTLVFADDFTSSATSPLVLSCSGIFQFQTLMLDATNGNIVRDLRQSCGAGRCGYSGATAALLASGEMRVDIGVADVRTGTRAYVYSIANATTVPPAISLTQSGIGGAWYAPYESGQGFIFDYIAQNGTLFIPWFTYSHTSMPVLNPSGLAWYSLQGTLSAGATSADLTIYVTDPGVFDSGTVAGHAVGSAHLSLTDCNTGILIYQFDAGTNAGAGGSISQSRLTPSTSACVLAGGITVPAQNPNAPAAGFDARQSGSWYDPNKSGQGVEMTIIPAGNGYAGLVFAAWFTFDPAGQSDDPINQHWFTLQGDLSTAAAGKVTLPIRRIIGGSLDGLPTHDVSTIGSATLTFEGCDHAQLDYRFDASDVAHAFAGLAGHIDLVKIGGCTSP